MVGNCPEGIHHWVCSSLNKDIDIDLFYSSEHFVGKLSQEFSKVTYKLVHIWLFLTDEGNLTSEPVTRRNGLRKTTSLHNAFETTDTRGHNRSFSPSWATREDHVSSLGFTSAKGMPCKNISWLSHHFIPGLGTLYDRFSLVSHWCCF